MTILTTTTEVASFCKRAADEPYVTIDTEFIRETTYWSQLCLIQVGLKNEAVAIDPLAQGIDLAPFFELLQNPKITKVFHAGRQDIEIFYHMTGQIPTPLFDTQIAGMVCGFGESIAYDALVQRYLKISIDKSSRYTHWGQRPLTDKQLAYALGDVIHLRVIYERLLEKITATDRLHWVEDEVRILEDPETYTVDPYAVWQKIRVRSPKPRMLAILRELAAWREITAQKRNVPRMRVMRDEVMLDLAASTPQSPKDVSRMRGVPKNFGDTSEGKTVIELIQKALDLPLEDCPPAPQKDSLPQGASALIEMLRLLLKISSDKYGVAPKLIATTKDLEDIAAAESPTTPAVEGWRYEVFGKAALELKEGKVALGLKRGKIALMPLEA